MAAIEDFVSRVAHRDHIFTSLGFLIAPIRKMVYSDGDVSKEIPYARIQFDQDLDGFHRELEPFCQLPGSGVFFNAEFANVRNNCSSFAACFNWLAVGRDKVKIRRDFEEFVRQTETAIRAIPCELDPIGIGRGSPFNGYLALRAICASADKTLELFDPYLGPAVFHRYLANVKPNVQITLVTEDQRTKGKAGQELIAVSQVYANERPTTYRLLVDSSLHDRHIRCDGTILHVGGTFTDIGRNDPCSVTRTDSPSVAANLDGHITSATEWFGPSTPVHRT